MLKIYRGALYTQMLFTQSRNMPKYCFLTRDDYDILLRSANIYVLTDTIIFGLKYVLHKPLPPEYTLHGEKVEGLREARVETLPPPPGPVRWQQGVNEECLRPAARKKDTYREYQSPFTSGEQLNRYSFTCFIHSFITIHSFIHSLRCTQSTLWQAFSSDVREMIPSLVTTANKEPDSSQPKYACYTPERCPAHYYPDPFTTDWALEAVVPQPN